MTNFVRVASEEHRRIRRFLVATLMSRASVSADVTQREERRRSNYSAREGGANSSPLLLFCHIGRRRRPNSDADFSASVPASQKNHERSEYLDLNWPSGQNGEGAVFVRFVLLCPSRLVRFSLHNFDYREKQGGGCGGFAIMPSKLCKSKMIRRGEVSRAKVDKGGRGR